MKMERLIWLFQFLFYFMQYQVCCSSPLSSFSSPKHHLCPYDQRSALLQFKHMFTINSSASFVCDYRGSPSHPKTASWNENATDCCSWEGVTCDELTGHVIGLDLSCSQLYGTIHPNSSLFQLSHLQRLNLAFNNFNHSRISSAFGRFANLTHLNLSDYSSFSGSIPSEILHLSKLVSLDLYSWQLRLEPHNFRMMLKNLTQLKELVLRGVNISSVIPESLMNMSSLTSLDLSSTELHGKLPESIFHLPNLQKLCLAGNRDLTITLPKVNWSCSSSLRKLRLSFTSLSGELPDSIGYLKSLNYLFLADCKLSGSIPKSLGNLTQITWLNLRRNSFNGQIPFTLSNLNQLTFLDLSENNLSGKIPNDFRKFVKLEYLALGANNFNGPFPCWVANLTKLALLEMSSSELKGPIPSSISQLQNLQYLTLANNSLNGTLPSWLFILPPLKYIDLSHNELHGPIPQSISNLVNLTQLYLSSNNLSGVVGLHTFSNLKNLEILDLHSNLLQGTVPIPPLSMRFLFISTNKLSGEIPSSICNASSLVILDLSHNNLSGLIPQCLGYFSNPLSVLDLRSNNFRGNIPLTFAKGNELRNLNLNGNHFEGPLPQSLTNCRQLQVLDLGNNMINDTFPYWMETLPELQVLVLRSNRFHSSIDTSNSKTNLPFPKLRIVDLSHNNFSGHLLDKYFRNFKAMKNETMSGIQYMGDQNGYYQYSVALTIKGLELELVNILTIFTTIDLSCNNFSGGIPNVIENSFRLLNLSHNQLNGNIPESLGDLTKLESLDLSSNHLIGKIPNQLKKLTFLAVFNLSWNRLDGPIPRGNQFDTFENDSYVGNSGLCGFPLSKECEGNQAQVQLGELLQKKDDPDFASEFTWKAVVMGYGCGMALGLVIGYFMFLTGRPKLFIRIVEGEKHKKVKRLKKFGHIQGGKRN